MSEIFYFRAPQSVAVVDAGSDEPVVGPDGGPVMVTWEQMARALTSAANTLLQFLDIGAYVDLRTKLLASKSGDVVELDANEFAAVKAVASKAVGFREEFKLSVAPALRSICEASRAKPAN